MDYANMLPELLGIILENLVESTDHLRFSFVCRSWQAAAKSEPMPRSLPFIQLPHDPANEKLQLYSPSEDRIYNISLPHELCDSRIIGCVREFLLMVSSNPNPKFSIINAITGVVITELAYLDRRGPCMMWNYSGVVITELQYFDRRGPCMMWDYSGSVVVGRYMHPNLSGASLIQGANYYRPGDQCWTSIKAVEHRDIMSIVYRVGNFCLLDRKVREIIILDAETLDVSRIIFLGAHCSWSFDLLASADDDTQLFATFESGNKKIGAEVFKFNPQLKKLSRSTTYRLDHYVCFKGYQSFLVDTRRHPQLNDNFFSKSVKHTETCICSMRWYRIYAQTFAKMLKVKCTCSSKPFWILPSFHTARE